MIAKKGKDTVSIPLPQIDIPHFKHGDKQQGGVGQGEGDVGDCARARATEQPRAGQGRRSAGRSPAGRRGLAGGARRDHGRGAASCRASSPRATRRSSRGRTSTSGIRTTGPESLRHFRARSGRRCAGRSRWAPTTPKNPIIVPIARGQALSQSWRNEPLPQSQRRHHLHDGRVGLDGRRAEGDRPHRVASGSIRGCARSTTASRAATSSTTRWPRRSIATRSSGRASRGGTMIISARTSCARR